ncbi:MAG: hypothetical protein ABI813_12610 [Bacteroidota bacterium]
MKHLLLIAWFGLLAATGAHAQNYHAIQGSSYAGALGVHNNPASIVNTPFGWDVVVAGVQLTSSTNAFTIHDYSLLSSPANSRYHIESGEYGRKANLDFNTNLLNLRIALGRKSSLALGANIRGYANLRTGVYNYIDTLQNANDFFKENQGLSSLSGKLVSSAWFEGYISYAHTLSDNSFGRLNGGLTLRVSKGLSGTYVNAANIGFSPNTVNNTTTYDISAANIIYGYSSNYDRIKNSNSSSQNIRDFTGTTEGGAAIDVGIEYLVKPQGTTSFYDEDDYYDYDWKFGVSLLDIGANRYRYGLESRSLAGVKSAINGNMLDQKFDSTVNSFPRFNDSLGTIANTAYPNGRFTVLNPARLVINVDHYLTGNFYINADLSVNLPLSSLKKSYLQVKEVNLLTVTPRWETKRFGFYLPILYNNQNQFWVGGAVKAGPLLLGVHNLANLFSKTSLQNGGGYIALVIRAFKGPGGKTDKRLNCPKPIW